MKNIFIPIVLLLTCLSCSNMPLSGHITMDKGNIIPYVYLLKPNSIRDLASSYYCTIIDSARIDNNGNFAFQVMPAPVDNQLYLLALQSQGTKLKNKLVNIPPDSSNYIPFVYKSGAVVNIDALASKFMQSAEIRGLPKGNEPIMNLISHRSALYEKHIAHLPEVNEENLLGIEKAQFKYKKELIQSVADEPNFYLHALAFRWASIRHDYERIPDLVQASCRQMKNLKPDHPWTAEVCNKINKLPISVGDTFPDFALPTLAGDTIQLRSLLGEKITIIDLWATWCAPCRRENRNILLPMWKKYHNNGLQIIAYALDSDKSRWAAAIKQDGTNLWPQTSHLTGDTSPFLDRIRVSTIPANYILDKNGRVLAKNLHGKELLEWIERVIGKR